MRRTVILTILVISTLFFGCQKASDKDVSPKVKQFDVTIDWVPSPEYYGFFYAKEKGFYRDAGLNVKINYGSGAPAVANELAAGAIYAGSTTSDNVLRQVARGADFSQAIPLLTYNPCVIASLAKSPIIKLGDLRGKVLGTNKQASVYQQLLYLIRTGKIDQNSFKEYPIGYGGAAQLRSGEVNAILAYTTNVVIDLRKDNVDVSELFFSDEGIKTYGLVLVLASENQLSKAGLKGEDVKKFIAATKKGYNEGVKDIPGSIDALRHAEPSLDNKKLEIAIKRIGELNNKDASPIKDLDLWVEGQDISPATRDKTVTLYR